MKGISQVIGKVIGFVVVVIVIVVLITIGDSGASNLENFFYNNTGGFGS